MGFYRRRRKRRRIGFLLLTILLLAVLLVSCVAGADSMYLPRLFGTDVNIYRSEAVEAQHSTDTALAAELGDMIYMITASSVELEEFHSASRAVKLYRDAILNSIMLRNYSTYVGNPSLSASVQKNYPHLNATVMIPAPDFENAMADCFGAQSVRNADGELFAYLSKAACYITPSQGRARSVTLEPLLIEETARTYRMRFSLTDEAGASATYQAMFVKRADGSAYIKALERI